MYLLNFNIPLAQGFVIDDMGWFHSSDLTPYGGPPRLHSDHSATRDDYEKMVQMAKNIGTRIFCAFVLSELDNNGICCKDIYNKPLSPIDVTEFGKNWHNHVTEEQIGIMDFVKDNSAYIDFALHGVRHGHFTGQWENGEWARRAKKDEKGNFCEAIKTVQPWDKENETNRVIYNCWLELIRQYYTEEEYPHPESFVPPNHALYYEDGKENTTLSILSEKGIKYCNFKCSGSGAGDYIFPNDKINFDHNVCILDRRGLKQCSYRKTGATPKLPPRAFPWMEVHFNNIWGTCDHFEKYLYNINKNSHRMLGKNTEQVYSQFMYHTYAKIKNTLSSVIIDTNNIPQKAYDKNILSNLTLKIWVGKKEISKASINDAEIMAYYKDKFGYAYLTIGNINNEMGRLNKGVYTLNYEVGNKPLSSYIDNSFFTGCIYGFEEKENSINIKVKVYRNQTIKVKVPFEIKNVLVDNKPSNFRFENGFVYIDLSGISMIGETFDVKINCCFLNNK